MGLDYSFLTVKNEKQSEKLTIGIKVIHDLLSVGR